MTARRSHSFHGATLFPASERAPFVPESEIVLRICAPIQKLNLHQFWASARLRNQTCMSFARPPVQCQLSKKSSFGLCDSQDAAERPRAAHVQSPRRKT